MASIANIQLPNGDTYAFKSAVVEEVTDTSRTFQNGINTVTLTHAKVGHTCYFIGCGSYRSSNTFYVHVKDTAPGSVTLDVVNTLSTNVTKSIGKVYWLCIVS